MIHLAASHEQTSQSLGEFQNSLRTAQKNATGEGLEAILRQNLGMLDRFVAGHIQVKTGRAKNSIFQAVGVRGNSVFAGLHSNANHAPYVGYLPGTKSEQFFIYAAKVEGPKVAEATGRDVVVAIEDSFR